MGEAADMILDGVQCQECFCIIHENLEDPPGIPVTCNDCRRPRTAKRGRRK